MKTTVFALALLFGAATAVPMHAQVGQDLKNAGHDTKDAVKTGAKKTTKGTKKAYHSTVHGVKKGTNKAASATAKGADKVAGKTDTSK